MYGGKLLNKSQEALFSDNRHHFRDLDASISKLRKERLNHSGEVNPIVNYAIAKKQCLDKTFYKVMHIWEENISGNLIFWIFKDQQTETSAYKILKEAIKNSEVLLNRVVEEENKFGTPGYIPPEIVTEEIWHHSGPPNFGNYWKYYYQLVDPKATDFVSVLLRKISENCQLPIREQQQSYKALLENYDHLSTV